MGVGIEGADGVQGLSGIDEVIDYEDTLAAADDLRIGRTLFALRKASGIAAQRLCVLQGQVPREVDPCVLTDFGDEGLHQRAAFWLGVDCGEMCIGIERADDL